MRKVITTERFDAAGNLIERVVTTEEEVPQYYIAPMPQYTMPQYTSSIMPYTVTYTGTATC